MVELPSSHENNDELIERKEAEGLLKGLTWQDEEDSVLSHVGWMITGSHLLLLDPYCRQFLHGLEKQLLINCWQQKKNSI